MDTLGKMDWRDRMRLLMRRNPRVYDAVPFMLSVIVGVATGLGAYFFIQLLAQLGALAASARDTLGTIGLFLSLGAGGLVTGLIIHFFASEAKGHGVPEVMESVAMKRGRIRPRVALAKILASAITIGMGGSAGREGPIVQVGSAVGSTFGQWFKLTDEKLKMLVASGAAAGIAATFNAPIAGAMFALEVILGRFGNRYLGMVVISAVSANVVARVLLGEEPAFSVPAYPLDSPLELPLYLVLGVLCALLAIVYITVLYRAEDVFDSWQVPLPVRTTVGMLLLGLLALVAPEVLGSGLHFIGEAISRNLTLATDTLLTLLVLKLLATAFTLGAGNSGGVFAPGLFMGALLGGLVGQIGQQLWPEVIANPGAFALVGMAAMFAGAARAPITAIIIVLEMSNDYRLIVPLMMTVVVATLLADLLHPESIYTLKLKRKGIRWQTGQDIDVLQSVRIGEVMTLNYDEVQPETRLTETVTLLNTSHHHGFPIVDQQRRLRGIVTISDIEHAQAANVAPDTPVIEIGRTGNLITVYPDEPVYSALRLLNVYDIGRIPVVAREDDVTYLGIIRRSDIMHAYDVGLERKSIEQHRQEELRLRRVERNTFVEVEVEPNAPMAGHTLSEFPHSNHCLLVSVRRGGDARIAHGSTRIEAGDLITAYVAIDCVDLMYGQFRNPDSSDTPVQTASTR
jgi:chloride channel protein, CIC family